MTMQSVADILDSKPDRAVHTIDAAATVFDAVSQMAEWNIGALLVVDGGQVVGIVTERDYARKIVLASRKSRTTTVRRSHVDPGHLRDARTSPARTACGSWGRTGCVTCR